jgi:hypothetical protein
VAQIESQGIAGTVVHAGDDNWDEARSAWNLTADQHPAAVVFPESPDDVAAAVAAARDAGLGVAAQGTGHGAASRESLEGTVLLRMERFTGVNVDPDARTGRFEAGAIWRDAANAAGEHGLATLSGSSPDVGVAGYTTGGGFGWLARRYGLACNSVRSMDVVTADGQHRTVDANNDADLFWALRGGGGNYGVVTAIEFDLIELPEVFAGSVIYPADDGAGDMFQAWREWTQTVPDEVTSIARFLRLPPLPMVPEPLRDRPLLTLGACYAGPESEGADVVAPLRGLGEPVMDLFQAMPPAGLVQIHMEPEEPVPGLLYTTSLREGPAEAIDAFVETAGPGSESPLLLAELRHAGGASGSAPDGAGARSHIEGEFVFLGVGMVMGPGMAEAVNGQIDSICSALEPWSTGGCYLNFADRPTELDRLYDSDTLSRLRQVKEQYDAEGVFSGGHALTVA